MFEFGTKNELISVFGTRSSERKRREIMENVDELRKMKMAIHEKLKNVPLWHSVWTFHLSYLSYVTNSTYQVNFACQYLKSRMIKL